MNLILVTDRDWFASALQGVLEVEAHEVRRVLDIEEAGDEARSGSMPDAVVIDAHVAGEATPEAIGGLLEEAVLQGIPVIVYSAGQLDDAVYANLLSSGAWEVVEGPVRSVRFLAVLERLVEISSRPRAPSGLSTGKERCFPTVEGVLERLPVVEALAQREKASIAVMAIGPTGVSSGEDGARMKGVADLRHEGVRKSDLWGWLDAEDEFVVVAYSASREGARALAERIAKMAADRLEVARPEDAVSVGVVELEPDDLPDQVRAEDRADAQREVFTRAREALDEARRGGGGVRFAH